MILDQTHLEDAIRRVDGRLAVEAPEGLLRIGSSARGELVGRRAGDGVSALGDLEYIHVTSEAEQGERMQRVVDDVRRDVAATFTDIAVTSIRGTKLGRLRHTFWLWEAARTGRIVSGHDFRPLLPTISAGSLDLREVNEVLLWRMFKVVEATDAQSLAAHSGGGCDESCFAMRWKIARQALDLTTWWWPRQGVLLSGFAARVERFAAEERVPSPVRELVEEAHAFRRTGTGARTCAEWAADTAAALVWADDERTSAKSAESRFTDWQVRSEASRFRYYARRDAGGAVREASALARSRTRLHASVRPLVEALPAIAAGRVRPEDWERGRGDAIAQGRRTIEWLTEEA